MQAEVFQFAVEAVVAARADPLGGFAAIAMAWAQIELDCQLQVVNALRIAQEQVELAQGLAGDADRQVGRQQFHIRRLAQSELPEALVVEAEATVGGLRQPVLQWQGVLIQSMQPVGQALGPAGPSAGAERMALAPGRPAEQRRREQDPGQVAHAGVAKLAGELGQRFEGLHAASIADSGLPLSVSIPHTFAIPHPPMPPWSTMEQFRNIGIIGRLGSSHVLDTIRRLKKFLLDRHLHVILEDTISEVLPGHGLQTSSRKILGEVCDLVIVVGGDGSMLGAARALARHNVPVLGINRGSLGFLTDIRPDELEVKVAEVLDGRYSVETRFLLEAEVRRHGEAIGQGDALNDVVLHPGKSTRMIEFELHIDGQFVCSQKADGLIIATPTGSTAYALSAGGPIMHPKLDAIVIVPMYPHTLSSRPIVVDSTSELKIVVSPNLQIYPLVSCDGQNHFTCAPGDTITVAKKPQKLRLIHPLDHNYYEVCRTKLGWGSRLGGGD